MSIASKITLINESKIAIKEAIESKGVSVGSAPLSEYASKIESIDTSGNQRPVDWPVIENLIGPSDDKVAMLVQVNDDLDGTTNVIQFYAVVTGGYTVDWGDGNVQNFGSGAGATHYYDYSNTNLTNTSYGYKCAVVTVTAQNPSNFIENFSFYLATYLSDKQAVLDFDARLPECTTFSVKQCRRLMQRFSLRKSKITSFSTMFQDFRDLRFVTNLDTSAGTDFSNMFNSCSALKSVPLMDTSLGTNFSNMFNSCSSIEFIPQLDTSNGTNFDSIFNNCSSLQAIPALNTSAANNMNFMFRDCTSLKVLPLIDMSGCTYFTQMFFQCYSLLSLPALNMANSTGGFLNTFGYCYSLARVNVVFPNNQSINLSNCKLSKLAIEEIFTNLPVASGSVTINVEDNKGGPSANAAIATAKGWTVLK